MSQREAWIWMIAEASWKSRPVRAGSKEVTLQRGQAFRVSDLTEAERAAMQAKRTTDSAERARARELVRAQAAAEKELAAEQAHQEQVAAYVQEWHDRTNAQTPTIERWRKGAFSSLDGSDALVDRAVTVIDRLEISGAITAEQAQGGHDFAALMRRMQMTPAGRSCLDTTPVGFDDNTEPTHAELRDIRDRQELHLACGTFTWREMVSVCVDQQPPRSMDRLRIGLDLCVKFWC